MSKKSFIEQCLKGDALPDEIDDFVANWHNDPVAKGTLRDYLGFSLDEYRRWAEQPEVLPIIISARVENTADKT